jgi:hypothetical protein
VHGAAALSACGGLTAWAAAAAGSGGPVVAPVGVFGAALLAVGLLGRWPSLLPWAIAFLGAQYAVSLLIRGGSIDELAPLYAAALVLVAELAYWALEERPARGGTSVLLGRLAALATLAFGAAATGAAVLVASEGGAGSGLELKILGIVAAAMTLGLLTTIAWRARSR